MLIFKVEGEREVVVPRHFVGVIYEPGRVQVHIELGPFRGKVLEVAGENAASVYRDLLDGLGRMTPYHVWGVWKEVGGEPLHPRAKVVPL